MCFQGNTSAHPEPRIAEPSQTSRNTPVCVAALSARKSFSAISKHCSVHCSELNTVLVGFVQIAILVREQKSSDFHISRHAPIIAPNRVPFDATVLRIDGSCDHFLFSPMIMMASVNFLLILTSASSFNFCAFCRRQTRLSQVVGACRFALFARSR